MPLPIYLAMTQAEFSALEVPPQHCAWLSCGFSSSGAGLSHIPKKLPPGWILMVHDGILPQGHDPKLVGQQLWDACSTLNLRGIALDFQRPFGEELADMVKVITAALSCPLAVTPPYQDIFPGCILAPPVPPDTCLQTHLAPWQGREIWLELSWETARLHLTPNGCESFPEECALEIFPFTDHTLHCHYRIEVGADYGDFYMRRTWEDQQDLLKAGESLGVTLGVGLYQEACSICPQAVIGSVREA